MGCAVSSDRSSDGENSSDSNHPDNQKSTHEGWESIRDKKRGCTDCLCLLLLIMCWAATTIVGLIALGVISDPNLPPGNPQRLITPMQYDGQLCGVDALATKPFGYYLLDKTAVCVTSCPGASNYTSFICKDNYQSDAEKSIAVGFMYLTMQRCMYKLKTKAVINRCIPDMVASAAASSAKATAAKYGSDLSTSPTYTGSSDSTSTSTSTGWFQNFLSDIWSIRGLIFGFGLGFSTIIAFSYTYFLRLPGLLFVIIWVILLTVLGCLAAGGVLLYFMAERWGTDGIHSALSVQIAEYTSYAIFGLCGLYLCLLLVIRSRVMLAIGIVKEAAKALATMPFLILMPIIQVVGMIIYLVPWTIYVVYLASSGTIVQRNGTYTSVGGIQSTYDYREFVYTDNTKYAFLYMLFSWFWTSEFIIAFGQLTIALSVVTWYFTRSENKYKLGSSTVLWAMMTVGFYHLGTAAFGSLIIAIIKTIRAVLSYLQRQAKKTNNRALQFVLCIVHCCMWCFEKFMKFMNKNAYIQTAIYGYSFCKAARSAFFLLLRNVLRVAAVSIVADFVLLLGKVSYTPNDPLINIDLILSNPDLTEFNLPCSFLCQCSLQWCFTLSWRTPSSETKSMILSPPVFLSFSWLTSSRLCSLRYLA